MCVPQETRICPCSPEVLGVQTCTKVGDYTACVCAAEVEDGGFALSSDANVAGRDAGIDTGPDESPDSGYVADLGFAGDSNTASVSSAPGEFSEPLPCGVPNGNFCNASSLMGLMHQNFELAGFAECGGVAVADLDGDGHLDIYVTSSQSNGIYFRNDGNGTFVDQTQGAGLSGVNAGGAIAVADFDNDGDQDLVLDVSGIRVYENDGNGVFVESGGAFPMTDGIFFGSFTTGDYDSDGDLDIYIGTFLGDQGAWVNKLFRNEGGLRFVDVALEAGVQSPNSYSWAVAFVDLDGDGHQDIYVANDHGIIDSAAPGNNDFRNQGDGSFVANTMSGTNLTMNGMGISPGDFDADGDVDLYLPDIGNNVLLENDGSGNFTEIAWSRGIGAGSYISPELGAPNPNSWVTLDPPLVNSPEATAWRQRALEPLDRSHRVTAGWATNWLDFNQDGWLDMYVINGRVPSLVEIEGVRQPNQLFQGSSSGMFADVTKGMSVGDRGDGRGGAYGDLDGDGDLDLLIANCAIDAISGQGTFVALRNDAAAGHYLRVHLIGVASNRDGVGAKVQVTIGNTTQTRWTSGGDGFLSVSQRDAHFGLGQVQQIDELRITWPSGTIDVLRNVSVNQKITITEGLHP